LEHPLKEMPMRGAACWIGLLATALACSGGNGASDADRPLTERQRDSLIGASALPGAKGVQKAMAAADSAAARRALEDSIASQEP
jgi:hypothetical protein